MNLTRRRFVQGLAAAFLSANTLLGVKRERLKEVEILSDRHVSEAFSTAGRNSELAYQLSVKSKALRDDMAKLLVEGGTVEIDRSSGESRWIRPDSLWRKPEDD